MPINKTIILFALMLLISCTPKSVREKAELINRHYAKTIILPDFEPENIGYGGSDIHVGNTPAATIVVYTDGDCGKCIVDLLLWQDFIEEHKGKLHSTQILFIAYSWRYPLFEQQIINAGITLPQIFDSENKYIEWNDIHHSLLHTLLLDNTNSVVLVGSPLNNEKLTELYLREIERLRKEPVQF